jgi:hypothetical protein
MLNGTPDSREPIPQHIQDFIFVRELSEVYLLIDHVSGRWDKSLNDGGLIKAVCEIGWPPTGTEVQQAAQAAVLLSAKDKLNYAARPASGATIAFTLLVSGEDNVDHKRKSSVWSSLWHRVFGRKKFSPRPRDDVPESAAPGERGDASPPRPPVSRHWSGDPPSRLSLARLAFPGLVSPAKWFKWEIRIIIALLLLWLMATCLLSWDIAAGHAIFVRVEALRAQASQYDVQIKALEAEAAKGSASTQSQGTRAPTIGILLEKNCRWQQLESLTPKMNDTVEAIDNVDELRLCKQLARTRLEYAISREDLAGWLADWRYWMSGLASWLCSRKCLPAVDPTHIPEEQTNEQWGAILLEVLASSVLPLCYGLLGAGAAVVRDLWAKMKDSLLSPRDLTLALGQLALGAVIGACIGLFVAPPQNSAQGASGLLGSVVLSASALSFIAGFGVEGVFVALESLIKRVFNIPQATKPT